VHVYRAISGQPIASPPPVRVLIADDDRTTIAIVRSALIGWGFEVELAYDGASAWDRLNAIEPPAIAILDWTMPEIDGLELCRRIRTSSRLRPMYVLLLTARDRRAELIAGLDAGADDYMTKPIDIDELRARTQVGARVASLQQRLARQVTELRRAHVAMKEMASTDALTRVYSRRWWFELAATEFARARRYGRDLSLLVIDLDHFKRINDTFGHPAGDATLQTFAELLRKTCRESDVVGRIGGEEFAVLLPEGTRAAAQLLAARVTEGCRTLVVQADDQPIRFSCSIGVTSRRAEDDDVAAALRRADAALYSAKRSGRDRWADAA
jgi:diguanylate cyclase (GGDEF)-like protein